MAAAAGTPFLDSARAGIVLHLHVQPGARRSAVAGIHGDRLKLRIAAPPVDGKANDEVCRFLARALQLPRGAIHIVRGTSARQKTVQLTVTPAETDTLVNRLERLVAETETETP